MATKINVYLLVGGKEKLAKGDNLYSASTVAIDVKTGQIKWHYQSTPNDGWDYDGVNEFVTYEDGGKVLGGKADRNGFFYVNDAKTGKLVAAVFSSLAALAAHDTNYFSFEITNLGQAGAGSAAMLAAADSNTTKSTGGAALSANTKRALVLSSTVADLAVTEGDRLRLRAKSGGGTLAGAVTRPVWQISIKTAQR